MAALRKHCRFAAPPIFRMDIKSFISILEFDVSGRVHADTRLVSSSKWREGERKKEREFLVSQGVRGDKNRETLYRFVGRTVFTIFLRAVEKRQPT